MSLALKEIYIQNVQAIRKAELLNLPSTGVIQFYGDNSNGKSILFKFIKEVISGTVFSAPSRKDLINWSEDTPNWCECTFVRTDNMALTVHVAEEACNCWFSCHDYTDRANAMKLPASSKLLPATVEKFGFHGSRDIQSLNLADQDDALMFFNTPPKETFQIIDTALTDKAAVSAIEELSRVRQEAITKKKSVKDLIAIKRQAASALRVESIEALEQREKRLLDILAKVQYKLPPVTLGNLQRPPKVVLYEVPRVTKFNLEILCYIPVISYVSNTDELCQSIDNLESLRNNTCPTCGTKLLGGDCTC